MDVLDVSNSERASGRADLDCPLHRFDVSEDLGCASVPLPLVRLERGACQPLMRQVNAFDPTRRDALGAQQVLGERAECGDTWRRSLQVLKRPRRLGHRRHGVAIEGEIAPRNLIGDEDVVRARPPRIASSVGARVRRPHPLLDVAERVSQDTLRDGRSRRANLSELQELCKDREETLRNDLDCETIRGLRRAALAASQSYISKTLAKMRDDGLIEPIGAGKMHAGDESEATSDHLAVHNLVGHSSARLSACSASALYARVRSSTRFSPPTSTGAGPS
jgi:hypothetical protein